jgi:hypothetical protein
MSTTYSTTHSTSTSSEFTGTGTAVTTPRRVVWRAGAISGLTAAAATTAMVVVARAADIAVDVDGERIPLFGFAQLTLVGAILGVVLAKFVSKFAARPRRTFVAVTSVLTALSVVPDLLIEASTGSKLVLIATHLVAAAIVVPALAGRLDRA